MVPDVDQSPLVCALRESRELAESIASHAGVGIVPVEERNFDGGEYKLRPLASVRGRVVFLVQSMAGSAAASTSDRLLRMLFLCYTLRDAGAASIVALLPYLAFARKDRRTQQRDPVTTRYVAQLLEAAGVSQVVALDVHNPAAFDNAFRVPAMHLTARTLFSGEICSAGAAAGLVVVSPDVGGIKRAQLLREMLERHCAAAVDLAFLEKRRAAGVMSGGAVVGDVRARRVLILDDLCASGGTLIKAAAALRQAGAQDVQVAVTHAPLPVGMSALLADAAISRVLVTDSAGAQIRLLRDPRLQVLPIAPLFASALSRIATHQPLTPLLERWPPES
jgi:ribose-phosphate pyrophosphokinase